MIYSSMINESASQNVDALLESVENRFEYETIAEATMIVVGEQEENWTRFMTAVGLGELATVCEGEEVIYEGQRWEDFKAKAVHFFEVVKHKLLEITKAFIAKVDQFVLTNKAFVKKYKNQLKGSTDGDFKFKGYKFNNKVLDSTPKYDTNKKVLGKGDKDTRELAENAILATNGISASGDSFAEKLTTAFYGEKEKTELSSINLAEQVKILEDTKKLKTDAKSAYSSASKAIDAIIKDIKAKKDNNLKNASGDTLGASSDINEGYTRTLNYWKAYSSCAQTFHGRYLSALGARNRQAKAICASYLSKSHRAKSKEKSFREGFVNTDAFLGAVEFI